MPLSAKLSPRLRKAILQRPTDRLIRGLVEISPSADSVALRQNLQSAGAEICSWSAGAHVLTIAIPASRLVELDAVDDVIYVEADDKFTR
jgi:hypothetical protein